MQPEKPKLSRFVNLAHLIASQIRTPEVSCEVSASDAVSGLRCEKAHGSTESLRRPKLSSKPHAEPTGNWQSKS